MIKYHRNPILGKWQFDAALVAPEQQCRPFIRHAGIQSTMRNLGHSPIVRGMDVHATLHQPTGTAVSSKAPTERLPVGIVIHSHHIALLNDPVLLG